MAVPSEVLAAGVIARRFTRQQLFVLELEMQRQPRAPADEFLLHPRRLAAAVFGQHVRIGGEKTALATAAIQRPADGAAIDRPRVLSDPAAIGGGDGVGMGAHVARMLPRIVK